MYDECSMQVNCYHKEMIQSLGADFTPGLLRFSGSLMLV